jgi:uncharacterized protein YqjF (DUF2071 family)
MIKDERRGPVRADWLNMVFLHLEIDHSLLQRHVPFELDLFEDRAYVSLVAFIMRRFRPRGSGPIGSLLCAPVARHGFLNVRTYVKHRDEPGIYFLTEWVSNPLSVLFGPRTYGLPYRWGRLHYEHDHAQSHWRGSVSTRDGAAAVTYQARCGDERADRTVETGSLSEFLLERYTAYTRHRGVNRRFRIWHEPWRVLEIDAQFSQSDLLERIEPSLRDATLVGGHASPGVRDVWIGPPRRVE